MLTYKRTLCLALGAVTALALLAGCAARRSTGTDAAGAFQQRLEQYLDLRAQAEKESPALENKSTPEQMAAHRDRLAAGVRARRAGARPGDIFGAALSERVRTALQRELREPAGGGATRAAVEEDKPAPAPGGGEQVKIAVNASYPSGTPRSTMPPNVLAVLPRLPDGLEYRFAGHDLLLIDTRTGLIVDFVRGATP